MFSYYYLYICGICSVWCSESAKRKVHTHQIDFIFSSSFCSVAYLLISHKRYKIRKPKYNSESYVNVLRVWRVGIQKKQQQQKKPKLRLGMRIVVQLICTTPISIYFHWTFLSRTAKWTSAWIRKHTILHLRSLFLHTKKWNELRLLIVMNCFLFRILKNNKKHTHTLK